MGKAYLYSENGDELKPQTDGSVGIDLRIRGELEGDCNADSWYPRNGRGLLFRTGVYAAAPKGYYFMITLRSSLGKVGFVIPNSPGIIDSDYRGEVLVPLYYLNTIDDWHLCKGDKIAQMILVKCPDEVSVEQVDSYDSFMDAAGETERGAGGFGSTGK